MRAALYLKKSFIVNNPIAKYNRYDVFSCGKNTLEVFIIIVNRVAIGLTPKSVPICINGTPSAVDTATGVKRKFAIAEITQMPNK